MPRITKGFKCGPVKPLYKLVREIRIQTPNEIGEIVSGTDWSAFTPKEEFWMVIKVDPRDYNNNTLQRIFPTEDQVQKIKLK